MNPAPISSPTGEVASYPPVLATQSLVEIATRQRQMLGLFLAAIVMGACSGAMQGAMGKSPSMTDALILLVVGIVEIVVGILQLVAVYKLAKALGKSSPVLWLPRIFCALPRPDFATGTQF